MIDVAGEECRHFQQVAWNWLRSGEITRTAHLLSPLEELCGFNYGFVYLMRIDAATVKIGHSEHPMRRLRELQPQYGRDLRLLGCFVGEPPAERFTHRRFANLRVRNELFLDHPIIAAYFAQTRAEIHERLRALHICSSACATLNKALDLRMLGTWLSRHT